MIVNQIDDTSVHRHQGQFCTRQRFAVFCGSQCKRSLFTRSVRSLILSDGYIEFFRGRIHMKGNGTKVSFRLIHIPAGKIVIRFLCSDRIGGNRYVYHRKIFFINRNFQNCCRFIQMEYFFRENSFPFHCHQISTCRQGTLQHDLSRIAYII